MIGGYSMSFIIETRRKNHLKRFFDEELIGKADYRIFHYRTRDYRTWKGKRRCRTRTLSNYSLPNFDTIELYTAERWHCGTIHCRILTLSNYTLPNSDIVELYTAELWHFRIFRYRTCSRSIIMCTGVATWMLQHYVAFFI